MSRGLAAAVVLYALLVAGAAILGAARRRTPWRELLAATAVLEATLLLQVLVGLARVLAGRRPHEAVLWLAYAGLSLAVAPAGAAYATSGDRGRGDALVLGVSAIAAAVITRRLLMTWSGG